MYCGREPVGNEGGYPFDGMITWPPQSLADEVRFMHPAARFYCLTDLPVIVRGKTREQPGEILAVRSSSGTIVVNINEKAYEVDWRIVRPADPRPEAYGGSHQETTYVEGDQQVTRTKTKKLTKREQWEQRLEEHNQQVLSHNEEVERQRAYKQEADLAEFMAAYDAFQEAQANQGDDHGPEHQG